MDAPAGKFYTVAIDTGTVTAEVGDSDVAVGDAIKLIRVLDGFVPHPVGGSFQGFLGDGFRAKAGYGADEHVHGLLCTIQVVELDVDLLSFFLAFGLFSLLA